MNQTQQHLALLSDSQLNSLATFLTRIQQNKSVITLKNHIVIETCSRIAKRNFAGKF